MNDDNSQSDEELIQEINAEGQQPQQPLAEKIAENNPFIKMGAATYQNVQTQSLVKSSREEAGEQLAAINARNAEIMHQQQVAQNVTKVKRTGLYITIGIIFAAILAAIIWLLAGVLSSSHGGIAPAAEEEDEPTITYEEIDGYKCTSKRCSKMTIIDKSRFIVHDGTQFYIYDTKAKKKTNTAIPEREYHAIATFKWGDNQLAILDPESEKSALYSITNNLVLTEFVYDDFVKDINDSAYDGMKNVEGTFIVAKAGSGVRLINIATGKEMVRGAKRVFVREKYYFGYETDGTVRAYTETGKNITVIKQGDSTFVRNGTLIVVSGEFDSCIFYNANGEQISEGPVYLEVYNNISQNYAAALKKDSRYFQIPTNN